VVTDSNTRAFVNVFIKIPGVFVQFSDCLRFSPSSDRMLFDVVASCEAASAEFSIYIHCRTPNLKNHCQNLRFRIRFKDLITFRIFAYCMLNRLGESAMDIDGSIANAALYYK
jgi:hypothetical protein